MSSAAAAQSWEEGLKDASDRAGQGQNDVLGKSVDRKDSFALVILLAKKKKKSVSIL